MTNCFYRHHVIAALMAAMIVTGCGTTNGPAGSAGSASNADILGGAIARCREQNKPAAILIVDVDRSEADKTSRAAFESATARRTDGVHAVLELGNSQNRAAAAPLHGLDAPTLVCLSPRGVVVSHDEGPITVELVHQRIAGAAQLAPELDGTLSGLQAAVAGSPNDVDRRMALADFLLAHHNDHDAIPHLERVANDASAGSSVRVKAWVALGRAHLWVGEPEKARHSARALMSTLGPTSPEAMAGGNLVRGEQDTRAKRYDRAREELTAAVAAAPQSPYGREAADALAKLPGGK